MSHDLPRCMDYKKADCAFREFGRCTVLVNTDFKGECPFYKGSSCRNSCVLYRAALRDTDITDVDLLAFELDEVCRDCAAEKARRNKNAYPKRIR